MYLAILCLIIISVVGITQVSTSGVTDKYYGVFVDSQCKENDDCAIKVDAHPYLKPFCDKSVKDKTPKCKCGYPPDQMAFYHFEPINNACLMSKYGPCGKGKKRQIEVGCAHGFTCIDQRCRDPKYPDKLENTYFRFKTVDGNCQFSSKLKLPLIEELGVKYCNCYGYELRSKEDIENSRHDTKYEKEKPLWRLQSYYEDKECSVGKYGPCGLSKDRGIKIDCHGHPRITCVNGKCMIPGESDLKGPCNVTSGCRDGLLCNRNANQCIRPHSLKKGDICTIIEENLDQPCAYQQDPKKPEIVCRHSKGEKHPKPTKCLEYYENTATSQISSPVGITLTLAYLFYLYF